MAIDVAYTLLKIACDNETGNLKVWYLKKEKKTETIKIKLIDLVISRVKQWNLVDN